MRTLPQPETAEWMGCTIEEMNRVHADLCAWLNVESQSLRIARGEILDANEHMLAWLEESAVLHVQRFLVALRKGN